MSKKNTSSQSCEVTDIYSKHIKLFAENNIPSLKNCLKNYIKLSKKPVDIKMCNKLIIKSDGKVASAYTFGKSIPTDLKWCVEQALWKADFELLQLNEKISVKFPLHFYHK